MKKIKLSVYAILLAGAAMGLNSCIGSFALTNQLLNWNRSLGNKFLNELVFIAFSIAPVYLGAVTIDTCVLNLVEFWSGSNPMSASTKIVKSGEDTYRIDCSGHGYTITSLTTGDKLNMEFNEKTQTWAVANENNELIPFMTFVDADHVKMIMPNGEYKVVELSQQGVMAYSTIVENSQMMANR